jgi:Ni/Co efflux regulator RcnB
MKSLVSAVAVIALLTTGIIATQAASRSGSSQSENQTTAQLNQQQLQMNGSDQQAASPTGDMSQPMPQAGTMVKGKYVPPGARCGNDNPSCAQQIGNPSVNSPTQMRLQGAQ